MAVSAKPKTFAIWFESPKGLASHWVEGYGGVRWEGTMKEANFLVRECERVVKKGRYEIMPVESSGSN